MQKEITKILVPVYYSEEAFHAACIGLAIAKSMQAYLVFLHIHVSEHKLSESVSLNHSEVERLNNLTLRELIMKLMGDTSYGSLKSAVDQGDVEFEETASRSISDAICNFAESHGVDMIVIGSDSRSNLKELFAGSISHEVVRKASCPVTVVH